MANSEEVKIIINAEVTKAINSLKSINKQLGNTTQATDQLGNSTTKGGKALKSFSTGWATTALAVGVAVKAFGGAVRVVKDFEQSIANVKAVSSATTEELSRLAREAGQKTTFSAKEAGDALYYLASAGVSTASEMRNVLNPALNLAAAGNVGIAEATDMAITQIRVFGMETSKAGFVADTMVQAVSSANQTLPQLGEALKYAGSTASLAGVSFTDLNVVIASMANQGTQGSRAGTQLRQAMTRLMAPTSEATKVLDSYGMSSEKIATLLPTPIKLFDELSKTGMSQAEMLKVLGVRQGDVIKLIKNGVPDMKKMAMALGDVEGMSKKVAAIRMDTLDGSLKLLKSAWDEILISMMTGNPSVMDAFKGVIQFITILAKGFMLLPAPIKSVIGTLVMLTAVILVITKVVMAFGVAFKVAVPWVAGITVAIGVLIAIGILLSKNWKTISLTAKLLFAKLKVGFSKIGSVVKIIALGLVWVWLKMLAGMVTPFIASINLIIKGWNLLTGSSKKLMENTVNNAANGIGKQIALEKKKLSNAVKSNKEVMSLTKKLAKHKADSRKAEELANKKSKATQAMDNKKHNDGEVAGVKKTLQRKSKARGEARQARRAKEEEDALIRSEKLFEENLVAVENMTMQESILFSIKGGFDDRMSQRKNKSRIQEAKNESKKFTASKDAYNGYASFMMAGLNKNNAKEFATYKAFAIGQATMATANAAMQGFSAMAGIPFVGPVLGALAAATAIGIGARNISKIASMKAPPKAFTGGIIKGSPAGMDVRMGERNQSEAIIPLSSDAGKKALGGGGGNTYIINVENNYSEDEDLPRKIVEKIDQGLYDLSRNDASAFSEAVAR